MNYLYSILFWFVLLATAIFNALIREKLLKPWLEPTIGKWAHQLSVITGFGLMLLMTMLFLKWQRAPYSTSDLWRIGFIWCGMTIAFEFVFGRVRGMSWQDLFAMYYIWRGELWLLLIVGLIFMPYLADRLLK